MARPLCRNQQTKNFSGAAYRASRRYGLKEEQRKGKILFGRELTVKRLDKYFFLCYLLIQV